MCSRIVAGAHAGDCAAVLDGGLDEVLPVQLWDEIMRRHDVAQACERAVFAVDEKQNPSEKERLPRERSVAVAATVQALARLKHRDMQKKLDEFRHKVVAC